MKLPMVPRYVCRSCARALRNATASRSSDVRRPFLQSRSFASATTTPAFFRASNKPLLNAQSKPFIQIRIQSRTLSQTSARRDTKALLNPRHDEEGVEMSVDITPRAANRLSQIMAKEANPDVALRVTVESGGCHGFQYLMALTSMSEIDQAEDTVFEGDKGARVVMDEPSLDLLKGSKVDYTMELIGSQFKITDNPLATSSCGCGTSFDIKAA